MRPDILVVVGGGSDVCGRHLKYGYTSIMSVK